MRGRGWLIATANHGFAFLRMIEQQMCVKEVNRKGKGKEDRRKRKGKEEDEKRKGRGKEEKTKHEMKGEQGAISGSLGP